MDAVDRYEGNSLDIQEVSKNSLLIQRSNALLESPIWIHVLATNESSFGKPTDQNSSAALEQRLKEHIANSAESQNRKLEEQQKLLYKLQNDIEMRFESVIKLIQENRIASKANEISS